MDEATKKDVVDDGIGAMLEDGWSRSTTGFGLQESGCCCW